MTDDVELPPLPGIRVGAWPNYTEEQMQDYARACVAHATAAKDAKIEALRAEVDSVTAEAFEWRDKLTGEKDRAERLAEALSHQRWCRTCAEDGWENCEDGRKADALLHPTAAQENERCVRT